MKYSETRVYKVAKQAYKLSKRVVPAYSSKYSKKTYTQHQHIAVACVKIKMRQKYLETEEMLVNMPYLCELLELTQVPDYTTMCKAFLRLKACILLLLLYLSVGLLGFSGKASIDSTGFDRHHTSKHYVKRCKMRLQSMKTTFLVDTETLTILDVHATVTRKHDTKILPPLLRRAMKRFQVGVLCADKGYDDQKIRDWLRSEGVRPLIKHREFKPIDKAHNARMKKQDRGQRAMSETANSTIKRKYTDTLTTRDYPNQKKEILLTATVNNIERCIETMHLTYVRISIELHNCIKACQPEQFHITSQILRSP